MFYVNKNRLLTFWWLVFIVAGVCSCKGGTFDVVGGFQVDEISQLRNIQVSLASSSLTAGKNAVFNVAFRDEGGRGIPNVRGSGSIVLNDAVRAINFTVAADSAGNQVVEIEDFPAKSGLQQLAVKVNTIVSNEIEVTVNPGLFEETKSSIVYNRSRLFGDTTQLNFAISPYDKYSNFIQNISEIEVGLSLSANVLTANCSQRPNEVVYNCNLPIGAAAPGSYEIRLDPNQRIGVFNERELEIIDGVITVASGTAQLVEVDETNSTFAPQYIKKILDNTQVVSIGSVAEVSTLPVLLLDDGGLNTYGDSRSDSIKIVNPSGNRIRITNLLTAIESGPRCVWDYLQIFDLGRADDPLVGKHCGLYTQNYVSSGPEVIVQFVSDSGLGADGFAIVLQDYVERSFTSAVQSYANNIEISKLDVATSFANALPIDQQTQSSTFSNISDTDLELLLNFEGQSLFNFVDSSPSAQTITQTTPIKRVIGRHKLALNLEEDDELPEISDIITAENGFTVGVWVENDDYSTISGSAGHAMSIISKWDNNIADQEFRINIARNIIELEFYTSGLETFTIPRIEAGHLGYGWRHYLLTYDSPTARFYIDGALIDEFTLSAPIQDTNSPIVLGGRSGGNDDFRGSLDDLAIWSRVLTKTEINNLVKRSPASSIALSTRSCERSECLPSEEFVAETDLAFREVDSDDYYRREANVEKSTQFFQYQMSFPDNAAIVGQSVCDDTTITSQYGLVYDSGGVGGTYDASESCDLTVVSPTGSPFQIMPIHFDVESGVACANDFVEIYDGTIAGGNLIGVYCNDNLPANITTTADRFTIRFVSNGSTEETGFTLFYEPAVTEAEQGLGIVNEVSILPE